MAVTDSSFTSPRVRDSLTAIHQQTLELIVHGTSLPDVLGALCDGAFLSSDSESAVF